MTTELHYLDIHDVSARYKLSRSTLRRMWVFGSFPKPIKLAKCLRWSLADLEAWEKAGYPTDPDLRAILDAPTPADLQALLDAPVATFADLGVEPDTQEASL